VTLLKDAQIVATSISGPDAKFQINVTSLTAGNYIFSVYSEDDAGRRSSLVTFPVGITDGATTNISGIFLAPTIAVDKSEVKRGDNIAIFGKSSPVSDIVITVNSEEEIFVKTKADSAGVYLYNFDTSPLEIGSHSTRAKASIAGEISGYSGVAGFKVGTKSVLKDDDDIGVCGTLRADLNADCRVNLVDFSIAAYWFKRSLIGSIIPLEKSKLNGDGRIDLIDFSIMAYYWTG
jgi:hypothetical protein